MKRFKYSFSRKSSGFTLIELMVTITIVGILYSVAIPSYVSYMQDARRSEAQSYMMQQVAILERQYTRLGGYPDNHNFTSSDSYTYSYSSSEAASASAATNDSGTFLIQATPKGSQYDDKCGILGLNHQGQTTAAASSCWL
ncbi:MAG: type IV pilin protein [Thalassotalea sp.]